MAITRKDLDDILGKHTKAVKDHVNEKFKTHEEKEMLIFDQLREITKKHEVFIEGDGGSKVGLDKRVDRIETKINFFGSIGSLGFLGAGWKIITDFFKQ